jgi:hypothetical protein
MASVQQLNVSMYRDIDTINGFTRAYTAEYEVTRRRRPNQLNILVTNLNESAWDAEFCRSLVQIRRREEENSRSRMSHNVVGWTINPDVK